MKPRISVTLTMYDAEHGGRHSGFTRGYAPHFVVDGQTTWLGVRALSPLTTSPVGIPFLSEFSLIYSPAVDYSVLGAGAKFAVHEGPKIVGIGTVLKRLPDHPHPALYCPRCGEQMRRRERGGFFCEHGKMELSEDMEERLISQYIEGSRLSSRPVFIYRDRPQAIGGAWFCPGCGTPIGEHSQGALTCGNCGQSIIEFVHHLIERHFHG